MPYPTITSQHIRAWAEANDVDGIDSFAQSSSYSAVILTMDDGSTRTIPERQVLDAYERSTGARRPPSVPASSE